MVNSTIGNKDWKKELQKNICSLEQLKEYVELTEKEEKTLKEIIPIHPLRITRYYLSLINKKDKNDPIRKMIIPSEKELDVAGEYDTSGEKENTILEGLQHKYAQTALVLSTHECAAYCRFCFRKRMVGLTNNEVLKQFDEIIKYIKEHDEITNVLISGGDSFMLSNKLIDQFLTGLSKIKHLKYIRFATRVPVVFPERINDEEFLKILKKHSRKDRRLYVVTHFNHPNELTEQSINAIDKLINANVTVNNQTVLMKEVNDDPKILSDLLKKLTGFGVNNYYVFQCRPVKRVKTNFQVPFIKGCEIIKNTKKLLDGHSKRFRYMMSHRTGKIEIVGIMDNEIYFKQHQARDMDNVGNFFKKKINNTAAWLDDLE